MGRTRQVGHPGPKSDDRIGLRCVMSRRRIRSGRISASTGARARQRSTDPTHVGGNDHELRHRGDVGSAATEPTALTRLAQAQAGAIARRQLRSLGVSREVVRSYLRGRRWQRVHPGTYAVFTGPLPPTTRIWAAILYAGEVAVASHQTSGWLHRLVDDLPPRLDVCVPHGHRHRGSRPGVRVRQSRRYAERAHPAQLPPRTRLEDTVLDLTEDSSRSEDVVTVLLRACQRRLTTASRLRMTARRRSRLRWRALVADVLADVVDGVQSTLERRYRADVERPNGLPPGSRNSQDCPRGRRRYRDVRYQRWRTIVELDGRAAHPDEWQELDDVRDNEVLDADGTQTVRYGWGSVTGTPCEVAAQVARRLRHNGWPGHVRACGPDCPAT